MRKLGNLETGWACPLTLLLLLATAGLLALSGQDTEPKPGIETTRSNSSATIDHAWPPRIGETYPDVDLLDRNGHPVTISDYKGKVVLIEPVGMNCPACQAFSGGNRKGGFGSVTPQKGVRALDELLSEYGVSLEDERIVFIQILLYDMAMQHPAAEDARTWEDFFDFGGISNRIVATTRKDLRGSASYNLIPGFQLLDKNLILRKDSTGHSPRHNLSELLSLVPQLILEVDADAKMQPEA